MPTMRRLTKVSPSTIGGIVMLIAAAALSPSCSSFSPGESPVASLDDERLQTLQRDPMYGIRYPNMTELRRVERGSRGFTMGTEDPPTIMYYAGTDDSDDKIIRFFIDQATSNEWYVFRGPERMNNVDRVSVILHKDGTGSLFVRTYDPEHLNSFLGEKLPTDYSAIIQVTLRAKHRER